MHPHPGFPVFARLDDVCGYCQGFGAELPLPGSAADLALHAKEEKIRLQEARQREAQSLYPTASSCRCFAAMAAVTIIAAAAVRWQRGR